MTRPPAWVTLPVGAVTVGRSRRTLRRWLADPELRIRTEDRNGERLLNTEDLLRVEAFKHAYTVAPTFGRTPTQKKPPQNRNVSNVTALL